MRTRQDVIDHFTYRPPLAETEVAAKAVHRAVADVEEYASGFLLPSARSYPGEILVTAGGGSPALTHSGVDEVVRTCALVVFETLAETPDRTAALRTLWLARGLLHAAIRPQVNFTAQGMYREAALVRLAEVRIQAIGAIVLAQRGAGGAALDVRSLS